MIAHRTLDRRSAAAIGGQIPKPPIALGRQNMRRIVRPAMLVSVIKVAVILVVIFAVPFGGGVYLFSRLGRDAYQCAEQNETISQTGKYRIEMAERACGGIAFSDTISLAIRSEQSDQQETFFSYAGPSTPKVKWVSDNVLVVELSGVDEIYTQAPHVGDVQIRYQIGRILKN